MTRDGRRGRALSIRFEPDEEKKLKERMTAEQTGMFNRREFGPYNYHRRRGSFGAFVVRMALIGSAVFAPPVAPVAKKAPAKKKPAAKRPTKKARK